LITLKLVLYYFFMIADLILFIMERKMIIWVWGMQKAYISRWKVRRRSKAEILSEWENKRLDMC